MAKPKKKRQKPLSQQFAGFSKQFESQALEQAKRVPWPRLAAAVDQYNEWEAFTLWLRAVGDAANAVPAVVERELETRIPGFLARVKEDLLAAPEDEAGHRMWNLVGDWVTVNVLFDAKTHGWLAAVHHFSFKSLAYMKTWAHWERVNREWHSHPPAQWPTYEQWQKGIAAVRQLPTNPGSEPQQVLDAVLSIPAAEWEQLWSGFLDLIAFSLWLELILGIGGPRSPLIVDEIRKRYPGFPVSSLDLPSFEEALTELHSWAFQQIIGTEDDQILAALSWHVQHHPAYHAMRNYAHHCHEAWSDDPPYRLPTFDEWRRSTEKYTE
jgi:hypothetical protein